MSRRPARLHCDGMGGRPDGKPGSPSFRLGEWLVEPAAGTIRRGDDIRHIEPKAMEVLVLLTARAGEVLSKSEITDAVWPIPFVSENRLTGVVADLRRALDDDAGDPRFVQTIPTRGYRLVAVVQWLDGEPAAADSAFELQSMERDFRLREGVNVIGRGADCDVLLDSEWVSRRHARLVVTGNQALIVDLGSKNGTHVNGSAVTEPTPLHDGDEIRLGKGAAVLRFSTVLLSTRTEIDVSSGDP